MDLVADQWFLFPAAVLIATLGMSCGIGGAILFSPLFMVVLELPPAVAIGTALLTQLFGFSSGVYAYRRRQLIDHALARRLLVVAIPGAAVGVLGAGLAPGDLLRRIFACGIVAIGVQLFRSYQGERRKTDIPQTPTAPPTLVDARGIAYRYSLRSPRLARLFAAGGGGDLDRRGVCRDAHRRGRPPLHVCGPCRTRHAHPGRSDRDVHDSRCHPWRSDRTLAPDPSEPDDRASWDGVRLLRARRLHAAARVVAASLLMPAPDQTAGQPRVGRTLWNGLRRRCPHCGRGPVFVRWMTMHDRCSVCGLVYLRNQGDTWLYWIVMDRIPIAAGLILVVFFGLRVASWQAGVLFFGGMAVPLVATMPQRQGIAVALNYLSRIYFPDPSDDIPSLDRG